MKNKQYIETAKNMIINRVKFHSPILFDCNIDKALLVENRLDFGLPIFKFEKKMTTNLLKAFELAKKEIPFNLVVEGGGVNGKIMARLKRLANVVIYDKGLCDCAFLQSINKLNINYFSASNYDLSFKDKFVKINNEELNFKYLDFSLVGCLQRDSVVAECTEFLLNGNNIICKLKAKDDCEVDFEINFPLDRGYYYFKRNRNSIKIENLLTKQTKVLNYFCRNAKFSFSNVSGLENSVYACVNLKTKVKLKKGEIKKLCFNFGCSVLPSSVQTVFEDLIKFSKIECQKTFDVKVKTKNPKFDLYFNSVLPKQIWIDWANGKIDMQKQDKYVTVKKLFVKGDLHKQFQNFDKIGLKEISIFNGKDYKNITIIGGDINFLRVGKTTFFNTNTISQITLQSKEPVCFCFG